MPGTDDDRRDIEEWHARLRRAVRVQILAIAPVLEDVFGLDSLRPLKAEVIAAAVGGGDALVVLPTGGSKSLCYPLPPLLTDTLTIVVSPLIALMKDHLDGLRLLGYPAAAESLPRPVASHPGRQRPKLQRHVGPRDPYDSGARPRQQPGACPGGS